MRERESEKEREREREGARESERKKKHVTEPKFEPTQSSLSGRRKPQTQGGTPPQGNTLLREQKKNQKINKLGLVKLGDKTFQCLEEEEREFRKGGWGYMG